MNYLQKRNGVYYFYKRVNKELAKNRNHTIRKSLQTKCYTTAKKLASLLNYWTNVYFEIGQIMTKERMDEILYNYLQGSIEEYGELEKLRHQDNTIEKKGKTYEGSTKKAVLHHMKKFNKLDSKRNFGEIKEYVDTKIVPISMMDNSELEELKEIEEFYWKLFKYYGEVLKTDLSKFNDYSVEKSIEDNTKQKATVIHNHYGVVEKKNKKSDIPSFDEMVDIYISHIKKKNKLDDETLTDYKPSFYIINEIFPTKRISELTTEDLEKIEHYITYLPVNRFKKELTRDLNIHKQIKFMKNVLVDRKNKVFRIEHKEYKVISDRTQNKHFEQISNFIKFCSKRYKFESPLDGLVFQKNRIKSNSSTERLLLSDEELGLVFSEFDYLNKKFVKTFNDDPLKIYGIFLTMYLGMRPIEAGQLMVNDLKTTENSNGETIHYLSVSKENTTDDKDLDEIKSQKTDNAKRKLPLPDVFINDLKFLDFVKYRKKDGHRFIFINESNEIEIKKNIKNTVRRCEDSFNSKLKKLDILDLDRKSFYSLRHSFANKIKHIPESLRDKRGESLMGHSGATDSELFNRYGNKYFEPDFLYEILEKVEYENFELKFISTQIDRLL